MMELSATEIADLSLGIIGFLVSLPLFLHPLPTFWKIFRKKNTEELNPYPYVASTVYCFVILAYCMTSTKEQRLSFKYDCLIYSSSIGVEVENIYALLLIVFATKIKWYIRFLIFVCMYTVLGIFFLSDTWWSILDSERRNDLIGPIVIVLGIIMYISPILTVAHAYQTKCVKYLPFWLCATYGVYGFTWTICACVPSRFDFYFAIVNGVGTILSIVQLGVSYLLLVKFRDTTETLDAYVENRTSGNDYGELRQPILV